MLNIIKLKAYLANETYDPYNWHAGKKLGFSLLSVSIPGKVSTVIGPKNLKLENQNDLETYPTVFQNKRGIKN